MGTEAKLDFSCGGKIAGRFMDLATYPKEAGRYRYMPYRGPGHLLLQEECRRSGFARCTYTDANGEVSFKVRTALEYGVLNVDEIKANGR